MVPATRRALHLTSRWLPLLAPHVCGYVLVLPLCVSPYFTITDCDRVSSRCQAGWVMQRCRAAGHMPTAQWVGVAPQAMATFTCASCPATM